MRGTASEGYAINDVFVPEEFSGTREDPTLRRDRGPLYAFTTQSLYAVGVAGVALGIARAMHEAFIALAVEKTPRHRRGSPTTRDPVDGGPRRGSARLGARLAGRHPEGDLDGRRRHRADRARPNARGCGWAAARRSAARSTVADAVYKAAGASAIFLGTPFERRFRDIHTLSQQIQSREAHFETVGKVMLGTRPPFFCSPEQAAERSCVLRDATFCHPAR